jgi:hypothetical protein
VRPLPLSGVLYRTFAFEDSKLPVAHAQRVNCAYGLRGKCVHRLHGPENFQLERYGALQQRRRHNAS